MLVSKIDKKKSGKKNVIILSTMHKNVKVRKDQRKKLQVHTMYDHTTGLQISVSCRTMTNRNKCLTDLKLFQSDIVSERKIKT